MNFSYLKCNIKTFLKCQIGMYVTSTCIVHIKVDLHLNGVQGWIFTI
jgi:hypothetical protein